MAGEIEAAGELVGGALLGRAFEPHAGEGHGAHGLCLNCGTTLIGPHCYRCGQAGHVHRTLGGMAHDIVHGVFHFDGKFFRTLPLLVWRPGELTRRYVEGERARFVSPMAIFLFSIFAMFAVFGWAGISAPTDIEAGNAVSKIEAARKDLHKDREELVADNAKRQPGDPRRARDEQRIAEIDRTLASLPDVTIKSGKDTINVNSRFKSWGPIAHGIEKWQKNPSLMLYKLQSSVYKFSWLLIPLSLPFMWLLFAWKRQYRLYDHTVFVTYSIAFMSLLFIAITLLGAIGVSGELLLIAAFAIPFIHVTRQLKQAYALRWFSAILRAIVLSFFILIVVLIFLSLLVLMGMTG